ncbi:MAG: sel1 repeat family protein, partial [Opitutae bacterium]|nr:sel1 repeat family protein [Opitutae bacterium]
MIHPLSETQKKNPLYHQRGVSERGSGNFRPFSLPDHFEALMQVFDWPDKAVEALRTKAGAEYLNKKFNKGSNYYKYYALQAMELLLSPQDPCPHIRITYPVMLPCGMEYESECQEWVADQQLRLGLLFFWGDGGEIKRNIEKALYWFDVAANQIHAHAIYSRGCYYSLKHGKINDDLLMAVRHGVREASEMQYQMTRRDDSHIHLKMHFLRQYGRTDEMLKFYKKSLDDDYWAFREVNTRFGSGSTWFYNRPRPELKYYFEDRLTSGQKWDLHRVENWEHYWLRSLAVEDGDSLAMELLVTYHHKEIPGKETMKWILKLANLGKIKWQIRAAKEYRKGKITRRKWKKSYYWMNKAAMQGDPIALFQLGKYCMKGLGTLQDHIRAYALLNVSCALKPIPK